MKYLLADYATTLTASVFNIRQKNVLSATPTWDYRQTGEIESKGAELSVISRPGDNVTLIANYAYTHAINTEDETYEGKRPTQVPENAFNLWGDYTFDATILRGLTMGAGARYTGPMEIAPDNKSGKLGGTTQYDLAVSYQLGEALPSLRGVTLKASAQNITNKETFSCYDRSGQATVSDRVKRKPAWYFQAGQALAITALPVFVSVRWRSGESQDVFPARCRMDFPSDRSGRASSA